MPYCLKCGKETEGQDLYCRLCGEKGKAFPRERFVNTALRLLRENNVIILIPPAALLFLYLAAAAWPLLFPAPGELGRDKGERVLTVPELYATIQEAVNAAADGDTVEVQPGVYEGNVDFLGKGIVLRSAAADREQGDTQAVIRGDGKGPVVVFQGPEGSGALLQGFTITGGGSGILVKGEGAPVIKDNIIVGNRAIEAGTGADGALGGGICVLESSPSIINNLISGNEAAAGAGIYIRDGSPLVKGNIVLNNSAAVEGGGIYATGSSSPHIRENKIENNAAEAGAGIFLLGVEAVISGNIISGNKAFFYGGGIAVRRASPHINENLIMENSAEESGGGISLHAAAPLLQGNVLAANRAGWRGGGGLSAEMGSSPTLESNIFTENSAAGGADILVSADSVLRGGPAGTE